MPEADGAFLTFPGVTTRALQARGGAAADFLGAYSSAYGTPPPSAYPSYAVAALQVVLAALERSDGTRKGVHDALFGAQAVTVPTATSVLGTAFGIDPRTGDVSLRECTVETVTGGRETARSVVTL